ncbi:MAG TPA: response regulator [Elusimicrobiota bacterium]|nr:response regulator [Elusimicrobiota bacterium]
MSKRVLIADDSGAMLKIGAMVLGKLGLTVLTATDGNEAVQKAVAEKPDIILLDAEMPELDGWGACMEIRKTMPTVPILMCTGHDLTGEEGQLKEAGANGFISKPYNPASMEEKLKPYL